MTGRYAVVDVETTGIGSKHGIVEIGAVVWESGQEMAYFSKLCRPASFHIGGFWPGLAVNGIEAEEVSLADPEVDVVQRLTIWILAHRPTQLWAYNAKFDRGFLERAGFPSVPWRCAMEAARGRGIKSGRRAPKLADCARHFEIEIETAHRALSDARTTARVLEKIL